MVLISSRQLEWLECLNNNKEYKHGDGRSCKGRIKKLIPELPEKMNLVFKEISELTNAVWYIESDINNVEELLSTLRNSVLKLLGPFPPSEIPKILKGSEEEFYKKNKIFSSIYNASVLSERLISMRLRMINTHPGMSWWEISKINLELKTNQYPLKTYKNGSHFVDINSLIKNIKKISNKKLQSAVNNIINSDEYWKRRKFSIDEKYISSDVRAREVLKNMARNSNIVTQSRNWHRYRGTVIKLFRRGILYTQELSEDKVIEKFRKAALEESKKCVRNKKIGLGKTICECLFKTDTIDKKWDRKFIPLLKLTDYGKSLSKNLPSILQNRKIHEFI